MDSIEKDIQHMVGLTKEKDALHEKICTNITNQIINLLWDKFIKDYVQGQICEMLETVEKRKAKYIVLLKDAVGHLYGRVQSHLVFDYFTHEEFYDQILPKLGGNSAIKEKQNGTKYIHIKIGDMYFQFMNRVVFQNGKREFSIVRQNSALKKTYPEIKLFQSLPDNDEPVDTELGKEE